MANIILQINTRGKKYVSPYVIIKTLPNKRLGASGVKTYHELSIIPADNYTLDASDFYNGALPNAIKSITYRNEGDGVVAAVQLNESYLTTSNHENITLPVNGLARLISTGFNFTDKSSLDNNTLISDAYGYNTTLESTITQDENVSSKYAVNGNKSGTIKIMEKVFKAPIGYYFKTAPSFRLNVENKNNYNIVVNIEMDDEDRMVGKTFTVFYTFPKNLRFNNNDDIQFFGNAVPLPAEIKEKVENSKKDGKIYDVVYSTSKNRKGGLKHIQVKGIPGTKFSLLVQDGSTVKKTYDFNSSRFKVGGSAFHGEIPIRQDGLSYGIYKTSIMIPMDTVAKDIEVRVTGKDSVGTSKIVKETSRSLYKLTLTAGGTGITPTYEKNRESVTSIIVGPSSSGLPGKDVSFKMSFITGALVDNIRIVRQPKVALGETYHAWDSAYGDDLLKEYKADATPIKSDLDVSGDGVVTDNKGHTYNISISSIKGVGAPQSSVEIDGVAKDVFREVELYGKVTGINIGTEDITATLQLLNFLTVH